MMDPTGSDPIVCRCEGITLSQVQGLLALWGADDLTEARILTRVGMGECQGRVCGGLLSRIVAELTGRQPAELEPPRARDPVRLVPATDFSLPPGQGKAGRDEAAHSSKGGTD